MKNLKNFLFQNQTARQTIFKNTFWLAVSQVGSRLIRAILIIYAARVLGAAEYGIFSYAVGLAAFFTVFADIGINSILTREASKKPEMKSEYFATALIIKLALLAVTAALIIFVAPRFSNIAEAASLIPFVSLLVIFDGLREHAVSFFRALEKMEREAFVTVTTNIAIVVFGFIALILSPTARLLIYFYIGGAGIGILLPVFMLRSEIRKTFSYFRKKLVRPILSAAWPVALLTVFGAFMLSIDTIMLGLWRNAEEIGFYSAGLKIVQVLYMVPSILAVGIFPALSRFAGGNPERVRELLERGVSAALLLALPIAAGGIMLGEPIIRLLYGAEYLPATLSFRLLLLTVLFFFPGLLIGNFILASDRQRKSAKNMGIGAAVNVGLNALLIPVFGIAGSAVATVLSQVVYNALNWQFAKRLVFFSVLPRLKPALLATLTMAIGIAGLIALGLHVLLIIALAGGIYFTALFIFREPFFRELAVNRKI